MSAYKIHDYEAIETRDLPKVRFVVDVDHTAIERCYRVRGVYDVAEGSFDELAITHAWSNDLAEQAFSLAPDDAALSAEQRVAEQRKRELVHELARFVECEPDFIDLLHREAQREMDATDPR